MSGQNEISSNTAAKGQDDPEAGPVLPGLLVDPDWLADHIGDPRVRIVDLRDREAHAEARIPGAVQLDLADLGEHRDGCENVILAPADFGRVMAGLGISHLDTVVAYDDNWGLASARLIWALHHYGGGSVGVLNGGWDRWQEEGRPTEAGSSNTPPLEGAARFEAHTNPDVTAIHEWIIERVDSEDVVFLDTRSQTEFEEGRLPGAICWDWFNAVPTGSWDCSRDSEAIRSELAGLGVRSSEEVVVYCRSGMRAAHTYIVLRHAGFPRVRLYDGSWQEWSTRYSSGHHESGHHEEDDR